MENKNLTHECQNCKKDFIIDERDQVYYQKINVPHPTWCPECRFIRRMMTHNVWSVYFRSCDKCDKRILSMYHKYKPIQVYCNECWWGDSWDGTEYAMDYDSTRSFFEQLHELSLKTPWVAQEVVSPSMVNSEYCNGASYLRNCYLTFWADYCDNLNNSSIVLEVKDCSDVLQTYKSELCYGSVGLGDCNKVFFSHTCVDCVDVWFSRNCYGCMNCVGCVNLRGQSYMIYNQKYSKEDYYKKISEMKLDTYSGIEKIKEEALKFTNQFPHRSYTGSSQNLNVTGEYIYRSKNTLNSYMCTDTEESRYCQFVTVPSAKECYDYSGWGANAQLVYETHSSGENVSNIKFSYCAYTESADVEYSIWTIAGKNNFGCVNLKRKKYCILNKEYSKEEYEKLKSQIIEDMKNNPYIDEKGRVWSYGEFFPSMFSLFGYNECSAMKYFPKTKEEVIALGLPWFEVEKPEHLPTISGVDLPPQIKNVEEDILSEVIGCVDCGRAYKIGPMEFTLLQKMAIPLPHSCPQCRMNSLFKRLNPIQLHARTCAKCEAPIATAFAPERPEIIYCEKCYQQEFS